MQTHLSVFGDVVRAAVLESLCQVSSNGMHHVAASKPYLAKLSYMPSVFNKPQSFLEPLGLGDAWLAVGTLCTFSPTNPCGIAASFLLP
jgi:hypothetical protein